MNEEKKTDDFGFDDERPTCKDCRFFGIIDHPTYDEAPYCFVNPPTRDCPDDPMPDWAMVTEDRVACRAARHRALLEFYRSGSERLIDEYSARALARVWKATRFSWWFTTLMHRFDDDYAGLDF